MLGVNYYKITEIMNENAIKFSILVIGGFLIFLCLQQYSYQNEYIQNIKRIIFIIYLGGYLYFTLFSREAGGTAFVWLQPLRSYRLAFTFDSGFLHVLKQIFTEGLSAGFDSVHIESTESLEGIILNILLFVPLGYMLPCIFRKLQKALCVVVLIGFVCSLLTETIQLVTHLGWFDLDDLLNNTIGCIVGVVLFRIFLKERKTEQAGE